MNKILLIVSLSMNALSFLIFSGIWFFSTLTNAELPPPIQMDDPAITFSLQKQDGNYCLKMQHGNSFLGCAYIGNSSVALEPYLGKRIHVHGAWAHYYVDYENFFRTQQCIEGMCHKISPTNKRIEVVDINTIEN